MFRKTLLACAVGLPLGLMSGAPAALADTDVDIQFGIPFYTYQVSPRYRYYEDHGWYDAYSYPRFRGADYDDDDGAYYDDDDYVAVRSGRLSCREARSMVRANGYRNVSVRDCDGGTYVFHAKRNGRTFLVYVNSRNGRMWRA